MSNRFANLTAAIGPLAKAAEEGALATAIAARPAPVEAVLAPQAPAQTPAATPPRPAPAAVSEPQRGLNFFVPASFLGELQRLAFERRTSVRSLILAATAKEYAIALDPSELQDKRRRSTNLA